MSPEDRRVPLRPLLQTDTRGRRGTFRPMTKPIKVYRDAGYLINVKSLPEESIDDATQMFTYTFYDESGCNRCELLEQRHCETCDNCPSFMGKRQLAKVVERGDQQMLSLPYGATAKVRAFLKSLDREYIAIDRHPEPTPFSRPIKLLPTVKLKDFQQEALDTILKKRKGLIEAPPRSGKTVIGAAAICAIGAKTLIIASQREWLNQFRETFIGSETAMRFTNAQTRQIAFCKTYEEFEDTDICLATPQQFMNERGKALLQRIKALFTVIVLDECFTADHEVLTDKGYVAIATLVENPEGYRVASYNHVSAETQYKPITGTLKKASPRLIRVTIGTDTFVCTPEHPFWVVNRNAYIKAAELQPGDKIRRCSEGASLPSKLLLHL